MEVEEIVKRATQIKKTEGFSSAIDYLLEHKFSIKNEGFATYFDKIVSYFSKVDTHEKFENYVRELIAINIDFKYSKHLFKYYWAKKDYTSFQFSVMAEISRLDPSRPWHFCFELKELQLLLCDYYEAKDLNLEVNAVEFVYNYLCSLSYWITGEIICFGDNFSKYYTYKKFSGYDSRYLNTCIIYNLKLSIENIFKSKTGRKLEVCLKKINPSYNQADFKTDVIQKLFVELIIKLGFKTDFIDPSFDNLEEFVLFFLKEDDFDEISKMNKEIENWKMAILGAANNNISGIANEVLKLISVS